MQLLITQWMMNDTQPIPEQQSLPPGQLPQLICWAWHHVEENVPLASLGQLSYLCPLPASHATGRPGQCEKPKNPWLSSNNKNISMLSTLLSSQIQNTALHQLLERKLTLSQLKPGHPPSLPFCRLNSPSSLSLSSYVRYSSPLVVLVALHWTLSSSSMSLLYWAAQKWTQYSRCGFSSAEYRGRITSQNLIPARCPPAYTAS